MNEVIFAEGMFDIIKKLINKKDRTIEDIDESNWLITREQLLSSKKAFSEEEFKAFIQDNLNINSLFLPPMIEKHVQTAIQKECENDPNLKMEQFTVSCTMFLDDELNRHLEIKFQEKSSLKIDRENIEAYCKGMFEHYEIDDEDLIDSFIECRLEDYDDEPFTYDYLDGTIIGFIDGTSCE